MGADIAFLSILGLLTGASTLAILRARNSQKSTWIEQIEAKRAETISKGDRAR